MWQKEGNHSQANKITLNDLELKSGQVVLCLLLTFRSLIIRTVYLLIFTVHKRSQAKYYNISIKNKLIHHMCIQEAGRSMYDVLAR